MGKNSTLADLDAFLKEQNETIPKEKGATEKTVASVSSKEEFVSKTPHQIVETNKLEKAEKKKQNIASKNISNLVPEPKEEDSMAVKWAKAIDETVKGSEMLRSFPFLSNITEGSTEQIKATEKYIEASQNIWKKFWD